MHTTVAHVFVYDVVSVAVVSVHLCGVYKGNPAIMDFKQTNKPKKKEWVDDYYLQMAAYATAHNKVYGTDIREGHIFMCSRDLQYQQFDLWPD